MSFLSKFENEKKRDYIFLDYARIIASFVVIFNHMLINISKDFGGDFGNIIGFNCFVIYIFFMITGYSFMKSKRDIGIKMSLFIFLKNFIALMIFAIPFCFMEFLWKANLVFDSKMIIDSFIYAINGWSWDHLWFMYTMLVVYLLLPFLSKIYKSEDSAVLFVFTILLFIISLLKIEIRLSNVSTWMLNRISFSSVIFCVTIGAFLQRYNVFDNIHAAILLVICIIMGYMWFYNRVFSVFISDELFLIFFSCVLMLLLQKIAICKNKMISRISGYTFIIYMIHVFFLHILTKVIRYNCFVTFGLPGAIIGTFVIYLISIVFSYLLKKIPIIRDFY